MVSQYSFSLNVSAINKPARQRHAMHYRFNSEESGRPARRRSGVDHLFERLTVYSFLHHIAIKLGRKHFEQHVDVIT